MAFFVLMPAVAAPNDLPDAGSSAGKADDPPPLHFNRRPDASALSTWNAYAEQARLKAVELVKSKIDATIDVGSVKHDVDMAIALWIGQDGRTRQVRFDRSSGDAATDKMIDNEIRARLILPSPPGDMPQPLKYDIAYHGYHHGPPRSAAPKIDR
jgi:hypothetical protein